jgi:hypothetical protein
VSKIEAREDVSIYNPREYSAALISVLLNAPVPQLSSWTIDVKTERKVDQLRGDVCDI